MAYWLYANFTLSFRDVEDLLAERGLEVSRETVRRWCLKFGSAIARNLRSTRPTPSDYWHLDEMVKRSLGICRDSASERVIELHSVRRTIRKSR